MLLLVVVLLALLLFNPAISHSGMPVTSPPRQLLVMPLLLAIVRLLWPWLAFHLLPLVLPRLWLMTQHTSLHFPLSVHQTVLLVPLPVRPLQAVLTAPPFLPHLMLRLLRLLLRMPLLLLPCLLTSHPSPISGAWYQGLTLLPVLLHPFSPPLSLPLTLLSPTTTTSTTLRLSTRQCSITQMSYCTAMTVIPTSTWATGKD